VARGDHSLGATGHCQRLLALVPAIVVKAGDVVVVPYHFALWLVLPTLSIHDDLKTTLWTHELVGWEFLGAALDELLPPYEGDAAVTPSVLRLALRKIGDGLRATATNLVVSSADMYEVYSGAIPTAAHIAGWVDFMFEMSYGMLLDGEGLLTVVAMLEVATAPRYVPDTAHKHHGCYEKLGRIIMRNLPGSVGTGASSTTVWTLTRWRPRWARCSRAPCRNTTSFPSTTARRCQHSRLSATSCPPLRRAASCL